MWKQGFSPGLTCLCCFSLFSPDTDKCAFARAVVLAAGEPGHERRETLAWPGSFAFWEKAGSDCSLRKPLEDWGLWSQQR